ncbi:(2,3-dihydroxybenzoyl)adenylate synthase [Nesterenkonia populi]
MPTPALETAVAPLPLDGEVPYPQDVAAYYRQKEWWTDQTHAEMLFETVARMPQKTAVISGSAQLSYAQLGERVLQVAAGLRAQGISRGDRVVVHLPNSPEYLCTIFALFELGAIPVLAAAGLRRHEIEYFIEFTGAVGFITHRGRGEEAFAELADELRAGPGPLQHAVVLTGEHAAAPQSAVDQQSAEQTAPGGSIDFADLFEHGQLEHRRRSAPSDIAFLQLSGGTTGQPKVIPHTHEAYLFSMRAAVAVTGVTERTVQLAVLPLPHSFAMRSPGYLGVMLTGGTLVLAPDGSPDSAFPLIEEHGVTEASIVPPLALVWLNSSLKERYDLSSLRILRVGGAKFSHEAARRVRPELGATLQQSFGMAEGLHTFTGLEEDEATITGRQGSPAHPGDEIRVLDDAGEPAAPGEPGHLLVRGPSIIRGYYRAPEHDAEVFTPEGFYRTGDIVRRDERGCFEVLGRSRDQINRGGEKIQPEEIENHLLAHAAVHDASVVGVPDELLGERSRAALQLRDGADAEAVTLSSLRQFLRERGLAAHKLPDLLEIVDQLERTAVGKISKNAQRRTR